jgi:hypothetical protein
MKFIIKYLSFISIILAFVAIESCTKDFDLKNIGDNQNIQNRDERIGEIVLNGKENFTQTVLGNQITNNPFTVENITRTWNIIYPDRQIQRIQPTDLYIRFEPVNLAQVKLLVSSNTFEVFDYPLDYEIVHLGEYYDQPGNNEIPNYYAMIPAGTPLPQVPYTLLEEFYYNMEDPFLIVESFYETGNIGEASKYIPVLGPKMPKPPPIGPKIVLPPKPDKPCPEGCVWVLVVDDSGPNKYKWECDCSGGDPDIGFDPYVTNDCGCTVYSDKKKPGGCINVQINTSTSSPVFEGVRDVKVILRDNWLQFGYSPYVTYTDDNGCFKYNRKFSGKMYITVRFKNSDSRERAENFGSLLSAHEETFGPFSGTFNNFRINFLQWSTAGNLQHISWGAATVNNEVKEFLDGTGDINNPPGDLDIWLAHNTTSGAAIMGTEWPGSILNSIPDLSIGIHTNNRNILNRVAYHEIAHASHFTNVGIVWWGHLMAQEIANAGTSGFSFSGDPHGTGIEPNAGYVALAESWADKVSADLRSVDQEELVFENGYIPTGLYLDLQDNTPNEIIRLGIFDRVKNYSRAMLFNSLKSNITNVVQYQNDLVLNLPTGNTLNDYNNLFLAYIP